MAVQRKKFSIKIEGRIICHEQYAAKGLIIENLLGDLWRINKSRQEGEFSITVDKREIDLEEDES